MIKNNQHHTIKKSLPLYLILGSLFFMTACSDNSNGSPAANLANIGDGPGGTRGGDGTGGGKQEQNENQQNITVDVDYTQTVEEKHLGIPQDPTKFIRKTRIKIPLSFAFAEVYKNLPLLSQRVQDFAPNKYKSYRIAHEDLVVQDSNGTKHPIVFYFVPYKTKHQKIFIEVYTTLNNKAYNTLSYNQSQTAYYLRGIMLSNTEYVSSTKWGFSDNSDDMSSWKSGSITINRQGAIELAPTRTLYPCYKEYNNKDCDIYDKDENNQNIVKDLITFQPIATVGYQDYNWFTYNFQTQALRDHAISSNTSDQIKKLAMEETLKVLKNNVDSQKKDIGWYGLEESYRNKIIRYHGTEVLFTWTKPKTNDAKIRIPKNGIKISHTTEGAANQSLNLVEITHDEMTHELKIHQVTEKANN